MNESQYHRFGNPSRVRITWDWYKQAELVKRMGGTALALAGDIDAETLSILGPIGGVLWWGNTATALAYEKASAKRDGAIIPLIRSAPDLPDALCERHICVDTTAAGGNADLLGSVS
jgi:RHH-type proline utilization regulon transcriptional repressor/proline dehydrogenase/delta 1-pyrroline-5-carboxylate dehydrogenase